MRIFSKIDERNARQVKNIFLSFFFRGIMVISSFITIPLCLNFLSKSEYGAWLTIYSILGWIGFFDLGLGNGLKNKISEAIAKNDVNLIKKIISTNYVVMLIIIVIVISIFLISGLYIDWSELINLKSKEVHYNKIITICFISFCFKLFLDSLNGILSAYQKPFYIVLIASMSSILSLISIYFLSKFKIPSSQQIAGLAYIVSIIPVIVSLGYSIYLFGTTFKEIRPEIKYFDRQIVKSLFSLGGEFFIIQVAGLIIFSSDTLLVAKLFDTEQVTNFNISIRLFSAFNVVWGVIISPYWVAFNESYVKQDYAWIKKTIKMLLLLWSILSVLVLVTLIFVNDIYRLWIGEEIQIPYIISINVGIYMLLLTYSNIFAYFINGVGKIRLQLYTSIVAAIINIPFSIYLVNVWGMGVEGIILSTSVSISIGAIFGTIQYKKIVAKNAYGIWNK